MDLTLGRLSGLVAESRCPYHSRTRVIVWSRVGLMQILTHSSKQKTTQKELKLQVTCNGSKANNWFASRIQSFSCNQGYKLQV